jgi:hypothetical protein
MSSPSQTLVIKGHALTSAGQRVPVIKPTYTIAGSFFMIREGLDHSAHKEGEIQNGAFDLSKAHVRVITTFRTD